MAHLTHDEALRKVADQPVQPGERRLFFSTLQGADSNGVYPAEYTAQSCTVLKRTSEADEEKEAMWDVRFDDGVETSVWEGEINGFFFYTGQFHGPFASERRQP